MSTLRAAAVAHTQTRSVKYFQHPWLDAFKRERLEPSFRSVRIEKPRESRSGQLLFTARAYVLIGYKMQNRAKPTMSVLDSTV